ncbi:MAG: hypothetical protein ABI597_01765 [Gammaproteobacteria bacterium]
MTASTPSQRVEYLLQHGHKFFTIIYLGGHVVMYVGNYPNPTSQNHENSVLTYQNMWGLSPSPASRRAVFGQAVFFPLLLQYPEDASLISQANKKYFQVSFLDEMPDKIQSSSHVIDLQSLMDPN